MRTARSSSRHGGGSPAHPQSKHTPSVTRHPLPLGAGTPPHQEKTPLEQAPPRDQTPQNQNPWSRHPPVDRHTRVKT